MSAKTTLLEFQQRADAKTDVEKQSLLGKAVDRIGRKSWTEDDARKYVGDYRSVHFSYAADETLRSSAASGGATTALVTHMLDTGAIDGVLTVKAGVENGEVVCDYVIVETVEDLIACQGSKYHKVRFANQALPLLRSYEGRVAVIGLPCDCTVLKRIREREPDLDKKVKLVIALVCGHNSEPELTHFITQKLGKGHGALVDYSYRTGHWRGELTATYEDGTTIKKPFKYFSDYRNLYMCAERKCHACHDHYGYNCDISVGDIWSLYLKRNPVKHTGVIVRTEAGAGFYDAACEAGALVSERNSIIEILDGQSRTMPFHYNTTARSRVGRLLGMKIKDTVRERVRLVDYPIALIALLNEKVSRSRIGRRILFALPRPVLRAYLYIFKGLELL